MSRPPEPEPERGLSSSNEGPTATGRRKKQIHDQPSNPKKLLVYGRTQFVFANPPSPAGINAIDDP
jgi:hypothetical protein